MKKAIVLISICMLANPLSANAITKHKKHHHKKSKDVAINKPSDSDASAKSTDAAKHTWLDDLSGTFDLTTNYMFRGISQSEDNPAVQGGLTYTFPVGLYFNVWGSNVKFFAPDGKIATSEFDTIVGWHGEFCKDFSYDINADRYNYPGARDANYNELNTLWSYKILQLGLSYSANVFNVHRTGIYYNATLSYDIPPCYSLNIQDVSVAAEMGHYSLPNVAGLHSYNDYSFTLNKKLSDKYTITGQWTATNGRAKVPPFDGNQLLATVTASF